MVEWFRKWQARQEAVKKEKAIDSLSKLSFDQLWDIRSSVLPIDAPIRPRTLEKCECMICGDSKICVIINMSDSPKLLVCEDCIRKELTDWNLYSSSATGPVDESGIILGLGPEQYLKSKCKIKKEGVN